MDAHYLKNEQTKYTNISCQSTVNQLSINCLTPQMPDGVGGTAQNAIHRTMDHFFLGCTTSFLTCGRNPAAGQNADALCGHGTAGVPPSASSHARTRALSQDINKDWGNTGHYGKWSSQRLSRLVTVKMVFFFCLFPSKKEETPNALNTGNTGYLLAFWS